MKPPPDAATAATMPEEAGRLRTFAAWSTVVPLLVLLAGCGSDAPPSVERTDSAGVEIVVSPADDVPLDWSFPELYRLGGDDEGPESFYRVHRTAVGADDAGRLHVLDSDARRVVAFDTAGRHVRTLGRPGAGPGELEEPDVLAVGTDGRVSVIDYGKAAIVRWDGQGSLLPRVRFAFTPFFSEQPFLRDNGDGYLALRLEYRAPGDETMERLTLLRLLEEDTLALAHVLRPRGEMQPYPECGYRIRMAPLFAPELIWDAAGGRVAVNAGPDYVVDVYRNDRPVRSLRRPLEPERATAELAAAELGEGMTIGSERCTVPAREVVEKRGFADRVPVVSRVAVAPDGEIWAQRRAIGEDEPSPIDIFAPDGSYRGTLPADAPFPFAFLPGDRIASREVGELDVERLVVHEVRRR